MNRTILDVACGSRMFWFDKYTLSALYLDIRKESHTLCDGRILKIAPDVIMDFRFLGLKDCSFKIVLFDPPHLKLGQNSWMSKKYGSLGDNWKNDLSKGFDECWRVLECGGTLIFKWSEGDIPVKEVLKMFKKQPLFGHTTGRSGKTKWMCFMKPGRGIMDTSKEYIEMCRKTKEIQLKDRPWETDIVFYDGRWGMYFKEGFYLECTYNDGSLIDYEKELIWLPRQDQLQGMIDWNVLNEHYGARGETEKLSYMMGIMSSGVCVQSVEVTSGKYRFDSIFNTQEKLWLAFVMKEKYAKQWDGNDWMGGKS